MNTEQADRLSQIFRFILDLSDDADPSNTRRINEARWDSLANTSLITAMESEFGISLDAQEIERLTSYKAALLLVQEKCR